MEQNAEIASAPEARAEYPKPTYEQLETKLGFVARKSNRRRAALRQIADSHLLLKYRHEALIRDYDHLVESFESLQEEFGEMENELESAQSKPWYKFW